MITPLWDFSYSNDRICTSADGISPLESVNADLPMGFSRSSYKSQNPPFWDYPHSESPLCCKDFSLSEPPSDILLIGFPLLGAQILTYGLPSFEPTGEWTLGSFSLLGSFHIPMTGFSPPTRTITPLMGYPHTRRLLHWWVYSHVRGSRSSHRIGAPIQNRRIQSIVGDTPTSDQLFAGLTRLWLCTV